MSQKAALKILARKLEAGKKQFHLEDYCFDKQLQFIQDPAKRKTGVCSRRSGKTISCSADLFNTALHEKGDVAYITLSRITAKRIIWRELLQLCKLYNVNAKIDNTELNITMPNGSVIYVSGAKDESEIEKFRGLALRKVYIDESQSFRSYIQELIEDVIEPSLIDYDGTLILIGTPGPVPAGYFYEASHSMGWSHHSWTMHDNPFIEKKSGKTADQQIRELCERRGVPLTDPSIRREFFGEWTRDDNSLVFRYNPAINNYSGVPQNLTVVFGIDIGWRDSDAIAVLGYDNTDQRVYLLEEYIKDKQTIGQLADAIDKLRMKYEPVKIVMDAGALGKKIQEEIRMRYTIPVEAADKQRKLEYIALMNDDIRTGRFKTYIGSRWAEDANLVSWDYNDPSRPAISTTYHSDICDAVLYAWRECYHYIKKEADKKTPAKQSVEYLDMLEQRDADKLEQEKAGETDVVDQAALEQLFGDDDVDWF